MVRTHMTKELYEIAMKYQTKFRYLKSINVKNFDATKILHDDWKKEKLDGAFGFRRTLSSVEFMLNMKTWYYQDKAGNLLSDKMIETKHFVVS